MDSEARRSIPGEASEHHRPTHAAQKAGPSRAFLIVGILLAIAAAIEAYFAVTSADPLMGLGAGLTMTAAVISLGSAWYGRPYKD